MNRSILTTAAAVTCAGLFAASAHAQSDWNQTNAGTHEWQVDDNWTPPPFPDGVGAVANVTNEIVEVETEPDTFVRTLTINTGNITLGVLNIGRTTPEDGVTHSRAATHKYFVTAGSITFDNGENPAQINASAQINTTDINRHDILNVFTITLNSDLIIDSTHPDGVANRDLLRIRSNIGDGENGPMNLIKTGTSFIELQPFTANTYTGVTQVLEGRLRIAGGAGATVIPGDLEIAGAGSVQHSQGTSEHIANNATVRFTGGGSWNPGSSTETIGGLEAIGEATYGATVGGGASAWVTFGGTNEDYLYEGRLGQSVFEKVGTGVQTLGGNQHSWQTSTMSDGELVPRNFHVLGGRLDLAKSDGVAAVGHMNLNIGDGTAFGGVWPEVRLLANEQIQTETTSGSIADPAVSERTVVTLSAGILNLNGFTETIGTLQSDTAGLVELGDGGNLVVRNNLTVGSFAMLEVTSGPGASLTVGNLDMADGANRFLDLTNSTMTVQDGDLSEINALVKRGYAEGAWTGDGISSSAAAAQSGRALGVGPVGDDVKVMFTWAGDATLDGVVNISDLSVLAGNWQQTDRLWHHGDFNYDGVVNISDLSLLAGNWQAGAAGGMSFEEALAMFDVFNGVVVPEPASIGLLAMAGLGLLGRRQRRAA